MEIEKVLWQIADSTHGRISRSQTYSNFLAYCALLLSSRTDPVHAEQRQGALKQLRKSYSNSEWQIFHQGLEILCSAVTQNIRMGKFEDLFGKTFMQIGASSQSLKQNFTPPSISHILAGITLRLENVLPQEGFFTISDPTCGSGLLLLSAAEHVASNGFNPSEHLAVQAVDLDTRCVQMAYLNLSLYGIPAVVIHGNAISLEEYSRWYTPAYLWGKWIWRAPMPFGKSGYASDEMLKRMDEPMYGAMQQMESLLRPVHAGGTADEPLSCAKYDEVQI